MYPILLEIGPITIYSLWIFIAIGFFAALIIINKLVQRNRLKLEFITEHSLAIFFTGLILSRLFYVIRFSNLYFSNFSTSSIPRLFYIWDKGLSGWGGVLGITLSLVFFAYRAKEDTLKWLDILAVSVLGAISIINVGTLLDGRNFGNETSLPWGVIIENSLYAVRIHPVQIYSAIYSFILTVILYRLFRSKISKTSGNISLFALIGYGFFRFLEGFFRGDESRYILGLREVQFYALLGTVIGLILMYLRFFEPKTKWLQKIKKLIK